MVRNGGLFRLLISPRGDKSFYISREKDNEYLVTLKTSPPTKKRKRKKETSPLKKPKKQKPTVSKSTWLIKHKPIKPGIIITIP